MSVRKSIVIGAALVLGMVLGGAFSWQPSFAQQREEQTTVGRYGVAACGGDIHIGGKDLIVVVDTITGQCWTKDARIGGAAWQDRGSPVAAKASE